MAGEEPDAVMGDWYAYYGDGGRMPTFTMHQKVRLRKEMWPRRFSKRYGEIVNIRPESGWAWPDGFEYRVRLLDGTICTANSEGLDSIERSGGDGA